MSDHVCPHANQIKEDHEKLYGNGKDGLVLQVDRLETNMREVKESLDNLATSYSALAKSELKKDAHEKAKIEIEQKKAETSRKRVALAKFAVTSAAEPTTTSPCN